MLVHNEAIDARLIEIAYCVAAVSAGCILIFLEVLRYKARKQRPPSPKSRKTGRRQRKSRPK